MATRVPQKDSLFDQYLRNTTAVLEAGIPTGIVRLGLTTAQGNEWIAYRDQWIIVYPKYTDPAQRTTTIKDAKNLLKKDFTTFAENPLKLIEASGNITSADRGTFRLPERDRTPTARGAITGVPFGKLKGTGGGIMEVRVRREEDATYASMHPLADALEFRYLLIDAPGSPPPPPEPPAGEPEEDNEDEVIPTPEKLPLSFTSKKAFWRMNLGTQYQGKRIIGYVRWVNLTKPEHNSGWSDLMTTFIS